MSCFPCACATDSTVDDALRTHEYLRSCVRLPLTPATVPHPPLAPTFLSHTYSTRAAGHPHALCSVVRDSS
ncbi:hypothetical protein C8Q80DRAFT_564870 [Daedaleopsis nitida]|nr:hypothetical protein C8Q80DRAFT_564870 [Daedaleopsis nitida]